MWPPWWEWDLALTGHAERRMEERGITEVDLRSMLQRATGYAPRVVERRFMITTSHADLGWSSSSRMGTNACSSSSPRMRLRDD